MNKLLLPLFLFFLGASNIPLYAQDDSLLDGLPDEPTTDYIHNAFKSTRVINNQSMEMLGRGALDLRILHRFGKINQGVYQLFGLDQASMRLGLDYGVTTNLTVGIGRSTAKKEGDAFIKYRLLWQSKGKRQMPVSVVWLSGLAINGLKEPFGPDALLQTTLQRRLGYYHALIVGRKFSERFTLQLTPTLVHSNVTANLVIPNNLWAVALGGRYKITKHMAIVLDYTYALNRFPNNVLYNPLSLGIDIETGGHVFQLHFSNAVGMNERAYISDNNSNWLKGEIQFGFNLSRVFQVCNKRP